MKLGGITTRQAFYWWINPRRYDGLSLSSSAVNFFAFINLIGFFKKTRSVYESYTHNVIDIESLRISTQVITSSIDKRSVSLLDLSSGDGLLLCNLSDHGFECVGLEGNPSLFNQSVLFRDSNPENRCLFFRSSAWTLKVCSLFKYYSRFDVLLISSISTLKVTLGEKGLERLFDSLFASGVKDIFILFKSSDAEIYENIKSLSGGRSASIYESGGDKSFLVNFSNSCWKTIGQKRSVDNKKSISQSSIVRLPKLRIVEISKCRSVLNFNFNHGRREIVYLQQIEQFKSLPSISFDKSVINEFYRRFQPLNYEQLLLDKTSDFKDLRKSIIEYGVRRLPWLEYAKKKSGNFQTPLIGPTDEGTAYDQYKRTLSAFVHMKEVGYHPEVYPDGYISGNLLVDEGDDYRFIVRLGNHRLSALSAVGVKDVEVKILIERDPVGGIVRLSDIDSWPQVRNGFFSKESAELIFKAFFK